VPVLGVVAIDELPEVLRPEGIGLEGEVPVRPQVVDPEPLGPGGLARLFSVEEEDVGFVALGVKVAGGKPEEGVDVHLGMASFLVEGVLHSVGKRRPAGAGRWGTTRHFFWENLYFIQFNEIVGHKSPLS